MSLLYLQNVKYSNPIVPQSHWIVLSWKPRKSDCMSLASVHYGPENLPFCLSHLDSPTSFKFLKWFTDFAYRCILYLGSRVWRFMALEKGVTSKGQNDKVVIITFMRWLRSSKGTLTTSVLTDRTFSDFWTGLRPHPFLVTLFSCLIWHLRPYNNLWVLFFQMCQRRGHM